jgi:hypothetical protein
VRKEVCQHGEPEGSWTPEKGKIIDGKIIRGSGEGGPKVFQTFGGDDFGSLIEVKDFYGDIAIVTNLF